MTAAEKQILGLAFAVAIEAPVRWSKYCTTTYVRRDLVKCIAREGEAQHLAVYARASVRRVLDRFEHQHSGALTRHEAVAVPVEGAARLVGRLVARRQRADGVE